MTAVQSIAAADAATRARFDAVIDVRSPGEFAEDHIPGAENLPVLGDAERAEVGTIYVQQSRLLARRIGAAYVARNIAGHLEGALADRPKGFRPLIHCWRGGQRSHAMATVLSQVGWPVTVLEGGYKTYRAHVRASLYDGAPGLKLVLLDGNTGSGKTEILARLPERGLQILDLEGLADHRGSLLGGRGRPQPSQKMFESRLLAALEALDPERTIVVEAESSKIGDRIVPPVLWQAMAQAPRIELAVPREARVRYLVDAYRDVIEDRAALDAALRRLPVHPGRKRLEAWAALADAGDFEALAEALVELHYDPAYERSSRRDGRARLGVVEAASLDDQGQGMAADRIAGLVKDRLAAS